VVDAPDVIRRVQRLQRLARERLELGVALSGLAVVVPPALVFVALVVVCHPLPRHPCPVSKSMALQGTGGPPAATGRPSESCGAGWVLRRLGHGGRRRDGLGRDPPTELAQLAQGIARQDG